MRGNRAAVKCMDAPRRASLHRWRCRPRRIHSDHYQLPEEKGATAIAECCQGLLRGVVRESERLSARQKTDVANTS